MNPIPPTTSRPSGKSITTGSLSHHSCSTAGSAHPNAMMNIMTQQTTGAAQMHLNTMALSMEGFANRMASPFAFPFVNAATFMGPCSFPWCYSIHPAFISYANMSSVPGLPAAGGFVPTPFQPCLENSVGIMHTMHSNTASYYVNSNFTTKLAKKHNNMTPNCHLQMYFPADNLPESEFPNGINCSKKEDAKDWMKREFGDCFCWKKNDPIKRGKHQLNRVLYTCKDAECPFRFRLDQIEIDADKYRIMYKSHGVSGFKPTHNDHSTSYPQHRPATNKKRKRNES